jgi:pimeloyl-ACP methyl ester carboxylesterase
LIVFLAAGDAPEGWRSCVKLCERQGFFFCAPSGLGGSIAREQRLRATLDVLDEVRRNYRIDPDRTYIVGVGAAADIAGHLALSLPEHFGGVVAINGEFALPRWTFLRQRMTQRLSIASVTFKGASNRNRLEKYLPTLLTELKVRNRAWLLPEHPLQLPTPEAMLEIVDWLEAASKARFEDTKNNPLAKEDNPSRKSLAKIAWTESNRLLDKDESLGRAVALLEWLVARFGLTEEADKATELLRHLRTDPARAAKVIGLGDEEILGNLRARATAHEEAEEYRTAREFWVEVGRMTNEKERKSLERRIARLDDLLARKVWLGARFSAETTRLKEITVDGPAERAGLRVGDLLQDVGKVRVENLGDLRRILGRAKPGDVVLLRILREGKPIELNLTLGVARD